MALDIKISPENLLFWSDFEDWVDGTSSAPTSHILAGSGASVARESSIIKKSTYSMKLTRSGADCSISHNASVDPYYRGKKVTLGCWVYATVASRGRLSIDDGISSASNSSYHTGGSSWEFIEVTHNVSKTATQLQVSFEVNTGDTAVYFDGAILCEGDTTYVVLTDIMDVEKFTPSSKYKGQSFAVPRRAGSRQPIMQKDSMSIQLSGSVVGATIGLVRTNLDTIKKVINSNRVKSNNELEQRELYLFEDRKFKVNVTQELLNHKSVLTYRDIKLRFNVPEPFEIATQKTRHSETISSSPTTFTVSTNAGNAPATPIITITNNSSNISSLTLENCTTGQVFSYVGTIATGEALVVDTDLLTVENNGVEDVANFTGDFDMVLFPESTEILVTGLASGTITLDWFNRWH